MAMNLNEWLNNDTGRAAKLAQHLGRTASAVSQWRTNGVPVGLMKAVRDFTNGDVSLESMVPDSEKSSAASGHNRDASE